MDQEQQAQDEPQYAIVEVFGHRRIVGEVREIEQYGAKMLRIDAPKDGDFANGVTTQFYGGNALFSVTPCDLQTVRRLNKPYLAPGAYSLPAPDEDDEAGLDF